MEFVATCPKGFERLLADELGLPDDLSAKALLQAVNLVAGAAGYEKAKLKVKERLGHL